MPRSSAGGRDFPTDRHFDPEHSLFWARWELWNEDSSRLDHDEDEIILGAEAAIQWDTTAQMWF